MSKDFTEEEGPNLEGILPGMPVQRSPIGAIIMEMGEITATKVPSVGRIVHYHAPDGSGIRAAIITMVHSNTCVNLFVFLDLTMDYSEFLAGRISTLVSSAMLGGAAGEWHWPVYVPGG